MEFHQQMREVVRRREEATKESYQKASQARLVGILEKKLRTLFIGDLAAFEEFFGVLWGHQKKAHERTAEEAVWFEVWQQARTKVLDRGNHILRAVRQELEQYEYEWKRYHTNVRVKSDDEQQA